MTKLDDSIIAYSLVNAESCHGTTVTSDYYQIITDSNNHNWALTHNSKVQYDETDCKDKQWGNLLLYWNRTVYCRDYDYPYEWWKWIDNTWMRATDPRPSPTSTVASGCTLPPPTGRYASLSQKIILCMVNH